MRENTPGQGYAQGHTDLVDRGPRTENSFDKTYLTKREAREIALAAMELGYSGAEATYRPIPRYIRTMGGGQVMADEGTVDHGWALRRKTRRTLEGTQYDENGSPEDVPVVYGNRPAAEEAYVNALYEFFSDRIKLWPGTPMGKEYLRMVMHDTRSTREIGDDIGVSHEAVVQGRQRAVTSFTEFMGGKAALAEKLRQYLFDRELQDGRDRLKYLPRWIHG